MLHTDARARVCVFDVLILILFIILCYVWFLNSRDTDIALLNKYFDVHLLLLLLLLLLLNS